MTLYCSIVSHPVLLGEGKSAVVMCCVNTYICAFKKFFTSDKSDETSFWVRVGLDLKMNHHSENRVQCVPMQ